MSNRAPDLSAKLFATETAQRAIDRAVQMVGGNEGASEVQKGIIAREMLRARETDFQRAAE